MATWCDRAVHAAWFDATSFGLIIVNAVVLGLETYDGLTRRLGDNLLIVEYACLLCFTIELVIRFGAHLARPVGFFSDGWNVFDLVVVCAPLLPGVRENVSLLRLVRLARIVRAIRLFPSLRIIIGGVLRSLPGLGGFLLIATLTLYGYAMVGWMAFGAVHPERYGTVGRAMLTLFLLLSLDGITDAFEAGRQVSDWSILYFASYIIVASYLLTNLLIGIVLKALEEAHQSERGGAGGVEPPGGYRTGRGDGLTVQWGAEPEQGAVTARARSVGERLIELRAALAALEAELELAPARGTAPTEVGRPVAVEATRTPVSAAHTAPPAPGATR